MKLLLDTNICIYIIKQQPATVLKHFLEYQVGDIGISSITLSELRYGVAKSTHREKNSKALDEFIIPLEVVSFDEGAAHVYGEISSNSGKSRYAHWFHGYAYCCSCDIFRNPAGYQ